MIDSSSRDLHPTNGGRFVLTRAHEEPPEYEVVIHLPAGQRLDTRLRWEDGQAVLDPQLDDPWAEAETLKLARVLRRTPRASLTRWRG
ncbi:MAG: hypothetical protein H6712_19505 [Myxococcales bacterium]|nr:hypothetical protein [Myxococcales bacterium]MCB9716063.1 hypothetical protein [Myxococcales bacterium]